METNLAHNFSLSYYLRTDRNFGPAWDNRDLTGFSQLHPLSLVRRGWREGGGGGGGGSEGGGGGVRVEGGGWPEARIADYYIFCMR